MYTSKYIFPSSLLTRFTSWDWDHTSILPWNCGTADLAAHIKTKQWSKQSSTYKSYVFFFSSTIYTKQVEKCSAEKFLYVSNPKCNYEIRWKYWFTVMKKNDFFRFGKTDPIKYFSVNSLLKRNRSWNLYISNETEPLIAIKTYIQICLIWRAYIQCRYYTRDYNLQEIIKWRDTIC